jgi:signal transduction histidine kinase
VHVRILRHDLIVGAGAALALAAVSVLAPVSGASPAAAALETAARVVAVAIPVAVGLYAWRRAPFVRFGRLLVAMGAGVLGLTLSLSEASVPYSIGRVANWGVQAGLIALTLAFPSGRLADRADRVIATAAVLIVALLYLPTAPLVQRYPTPAPWVVCSSDCPPNAFMAVAHEPELIDQVVVPVREVLTGALFVALLTRLARRIRGATRLRRRTLTPVLAVAMVWALVFAGALGARRASPGAWPAEGGVWLIGLAVPAMATGFLVGLLGWWLYVNTSLRRLAARLRRPVRPEELRDALAEAFEDPSLQAVYRLDDRWVDAQGTTVPTPAAGSLRSMTEVGDGERTTGALVYDAALDHEQAFIDAAAAFAAASFENHRLVAEAELLQRELEGSRERIAASAAEERREIERDLHDGAQQRLISLQIRLERAAERLDVEPTAGAEVLRELGTDVQAAYEEVRTFAHVIYPAILIERGLAAALTSSATDAPLPATVVAERVGRYPAPIEKAVYFCCLEALQNASKHAGREAAVRITVTDSDDTLSFEVHDTGVGFDPRIVPAGVGLTNIQDRVSAIGGRAAIQSAPGSGTRISATIPLSRAAVTAATDHDS